ncbi:MAG: four helix bundle protein [Bacteroidota bacterium]|nr:four helix bundle protein [Bacteroidota bacterium]
MGTYKDLVLYKKSFDLAMDIFVATKLFPKEETYSLTDQIRRSSRSENICTIEAYRKRKYPNHFVSKLTDVDMENSETQGWLEFAKECNYISTEVYNKLYALSDEIGRLVQ